MANRKLTLLAAAVMGAMLAASAGAQDRNMSSYPDSGDRGVVTPAQVQDATGPTVDPAVGTGPSYIPSINSPKGVPDEQTDRVGQKYQSPLVRDSRLRPSPITPGNVSDGNMSASRYNHTNDGGMGIGSTR